MTDRDQGLRSQMNARQRNELLQLCGDVCNGTLSDAGERRLAELLRDDAAAQGIYAQYMMVHAELYWQQTGLLGRGPVTDVGSSGGELAKAGSDGPGWWIAVAAVLLIGIGCGWWIGQRTGGTVGQTGRRADRGSDAVSVHPVARVTGTLNCRWRSAPGDASIGFGSSLRAGQSLELIEGVAELTFENGARVILQAPARLDVASFAETTLQQGRVTATCPPGAEGFQINTEGLRLIDRGTEFGVFADEDGNTEVHVFEGLVEGQYRDPEQGDWKTVQWRTNETVRFEKASQAIRSVERASTTFVRTLSANLGPATGLLTGEDFDYPVGPLGGQNGGFGWGGPWDILNVASTRSAGRPSCQVPAGSLRYSILPSSGNRARLAGNFNRVRRILSTSFGGVYDAAGFVEDQDGARLIGRDGTVLYLSFTQQIDRLNQVFYGFELNRGDGNRNRVICIGHGAARGWVEGTIRTPNKEAGVTGWAVTSEYNGQDGFLAELGDLGPETLDVTLFVVKMTFGQGNRDTIEVFKNPASLWDEQLCVPDVVGHGNFAFDRISLANFEGQKIYDVDNIRIGTSFSAVTRPGQSSPPASVSTNRVGGGERSE